MRVFLISLALFAAACSSPEDAPGAACGDGQVLHVGFYAFFAPVSYSADAPGTAGFDEHLGYEADLLTALAAMDGAGLSFVRQGLAEWADIWLQAAGPEFDLVGGGITILDARTRNADGDRVVTFTSGHIAFRQSLLVRAADAARFAHYSDLTSQARVGVLGGTTGEFRLLELTGLVDAQGTLAASTRIQTPEGELVADGTASYTITAAGTSANLVGRQRLIPPEAHMPQVIYLGGEIGEVELLEALQSGQIDAIARGEIGNRDASYASDNSLVVAALDEAAEPGGFALGADDTDLAACLDEKINYLTDHQRIGYQEWRANPAVFLARAEQWRP